MKPPVEGAGGPGRSFHVEHGLRIALGPRSDVPPNTLPAGQRPRGPRGRPSEEGSLGRHPVAPGKAIRAGRRLPERAVLEVLVDHVGRFEAELAQRSAGGQRVLLASVPGPLRGGSETTSHPPTRSKRAAHSATTAGRPKERARTPSNPPLRPSWRPQSSARPSSTVTRSASPRRSTARRRKAALRPLASSSATEASGQPSATTRPGSPPPEPRSTSLVGPVGRQAVGDGGEALGVMELGLDRPGAEEAGGTGLG